MSDKYKRTIGRENMFLTETELNEHLKEQIEFLILSSQSYDNGYESEAKRLAVVCRVLLHDTDKSHSLLKLLNRKNIHLYDSSYRYASKNLLPHWGLIALRQHNSPYGDSYTKFIPLLEDVPPYQRKGKRSFKNWWTKEIILEDSEKNPFTRRDLVLGLANKDGGAHVDPKLSHKYGNLIHKNATGWVNGNDVKSTPIFGGELASMRQIAHEVLKTLKDEFPEYF
jgi:hypothetical protein